MTRGHRLSSLVRLACVASVIAGCAIVGPSAPLGDAEPPPAATPATSAQITVAPGARMATIPRSFLGLSTEYWSLPAWAPQMAQLERVVALVHATGDGPMVLRIGGDSADHAFWDPDRAPLPRWAFGIGPGLLAQVGTLVRREHLEVILDLNLVTDTPAQAAAWAGAAEAALPRRSIVAFEVGNEPDIYSRADWAAITAAGPGTSWGMAAPRLPAMVTPAVYARDVLAYRAALSKVAPRVPLAGPALADPVSHERWLPEVLGATHGAVGLVTIHRYPYTGCRRRRHTRGYATIARLLSPAASTGMARALRPDVVAARDAGRPLRMTELNSVNCGGRPGVSDSFATALWAPSALFALARAGVAGVNLHVRADAINAPFALNSSGLSARPLLYGLILFSRTLGPDARLVALRARHARSLNLSAWAVRVGRRTLHLLLIDKSRRSAHVTLRLPADGVLTVQRLLAPSIFSRTGVTLAGRSLGPDARWHGATLTQAIRPRRRMYTVDVGGHSAALLSVPVAPGALGTAARLRRGLA